MSKLNRRSLITGAAVVPAMALPAIAVGAALTAPQLDPVFAAIARHVKTWDAFAEAVEAEDDASYRYGKGSVEHRAAEAAYERAFSDERAAVEVFVRTTPATAAGLIAYLDHIAHPAAWGVNAFDEKDVWAIITTARDAIPQIVAARS